MRECDDRNVYDGWTVSQAIFGRKIFYMVALCLFLCVIDIGLLALGMEQTINIFKNEVKTFILVKFQLIKICFYFCTGFWTIRLQMNA